MSCRWMWKIIWFSFFLLGYQVGDVLNQLHQDCHDDIHYSLFFFNIDPQIIYCYCFFTVASSPIIIFVCLFVCHPSVCSIITQFVCHNFFIMFLTPDLRETYKRYSSHEMFMTCMFSPKVKGQSNMGHGSFCVHSMAPCLFHFIFGMNTTHKATMCSEPLPVQYVKGLCHTACLKFLPCPLVYRCCC